MTYLRGLVLIVAALLMLHGLAEAGPERKRMQDVNTSVSADEPPRSHLSSTDSHILPSRSVRSSLRAYDGASNAEEGATHKKFAKASVSQTSEKHSSRSFSDPQETAASGPQHGSDLVNLQKRSSSALSLMVTISGTSTNTTIYDDTCGRLASDNELRELVFINRSPPVHFDLPSCTRNSDLMSITAPYAIVRSFDIFPASLEILLVANGIFDSLNPGSGSPVPSTPVAQARGFKADGTIDWVDIFAELPNLVEFSFNGAILRGSLPSVLPQPTRRFHMRDTALSGDLPSGLLSDIGAQSGLNSIDLDVANTNIGGSIPSNFFAAFDQNLITRVALDFSGTQLDDDLPNGLFTPLQTADMLEFVFNIASTDIEGELPIPLLPSGVVRSSGSFTFNAAFCSFEDSISATLLANMPATTNINISNNELEGPLPPHLFDNGASLTSLVLDLSGNSIDGELGSLMSSSWATNVTMSSLTILLNDNELTGPIDEGLLINYDNSKRDAEDRGHFLSLGRSSAASAAEPSHIAVTNLLHISLAGNRLSGQIPPGLLSLAFSPGAPLSGGVTLDFSNNRLSGYFPGNLLAGLPNGASGSITVALSNNSFTGTLPSFCRSSAPLTIDVSRNNFTGSIPNSWQGCKMSKVALNDNPHLSGSIPPNLLDTTGITAFAAKNSSLSGVLPRLGSTLISLDLSRSKIQLCHPTSIASFSGFEDSCSLSSSDACNCASSYSQCGASISCPPPGFVPPYASTPIALPPTGCRATARPGPEFTCVNDRWTAAVVTSPALVIPPGAGTVVVTGDIDSTEIVIRSLSSSVQVTGCANNLTAINMELTKEEIEQIGKGTLTQTLFSTSHTGCNNLNSVNLNTRVSNQGCKKLRATKQVSPDGATLTGIFSLQTSSCNTWWIILVAVLCGVIAVAVFIIIVIVMCCESCKTKLLPFAGSSARRRAVTYKTDP